MNIPEDLKEELKDVIFDGYPKKMLCFIEGYQPLEDIILCERKGRPFPFIGKKYSYKKVEDIPQKTKTDIDQLCLHDKFIIETNINNIVVTRKICMVEGFLEALIVVSVFNDSDKFIAIEMLRICDLKKSKIIFL